jgi:hypothetical protein
MASFLDSTLGRVLFAGSEMDKLHQQEKQKAAYKSLLGQYGVTEQPGPVGGLMSDQPVPPQFYLQAAAIPGYEQLAQQGQVGGQQAMLEQMRQNFQQNVIPAAEQRRLELMQQEAERPYGQMTAYQQRMAGIASQRDLMDFMLGSQKNQPEAPKSLWDRLPPDKQAQYGTELLGMDDQVASLNNVIDWADKRAATSTIPAVGSGDRAAFEAEWQLTALPAIKTILGSGALDNSERDFMLELSGDPGAIFTTDAKRKRFKVIAAKVARTRENRYRALGLEPGPLPTAASAQVMGGGVTPQGSLKPYQPASPTAASGPIYRGLIQRD